MTATVTPSPRVTDQAAWALSMLSTHCSLAWMLSAEAAAASGAGAAASAARPTQPTRLAPASRAGPGGPPRGSLPRSPATGRGRGGVRQHGDADGHNVAPGGVDIGRPEHRLAPVLAQRRSGRGAGHCLAAVRLLGRDADPERFQIERGHVLEHTGGELVGDRGR